MSVLKVLHTEENTLRNTVLKITNLDLTSGTKTLKLNNLYVQNGVNNDGSLIIHYTGSSVTLPIEGNTQPPVLYTVNWGDGTIEVLSINNPTHTYASSQLYIIKIYIVTQGILVKFGQNTNPIWQNVSRIPSLGNERQCDDMFTNILSFPSQVTSDLQIWNTSQVTTMISMFKNSGFNGAIGGWNTGNVTDMYDMFSGATSFNKPLNNWNTGNVIYMGGMFSSAPSFNQPLNNWNTDNVTYMYAMFAGATSFNKPLDNNWNTINVNDMDSMFSGASSFNQPLNTNNWNTSNVVYMNNMFYNASSFNQPLNNWNTVNVITMESMFRNASAFSQDLGDWDTSNVTTMDFMFFGTGGGSGFTTNNYKSLRNWNISSVITMSQMFRYIIQVPSFTPITNYSYGTFTTMLYEWDTNSTLQTGVTLGVNALQGVTDIQFQNTTLKQYYQGLNWVFEESGSPGTTVDIWSAGMTCSTSQFQFIWEGLSTETIAITIISPASYRVNWGDGIISNYSSTTSTTHTYTDDGTYVITVEPTNPINWLSLTISFVPGTFFTGLYSVPCCGLIQDCYQMFNNITTNKPHVLETIKWWNTQSITNMEAMFGSTNMNVDLSLWDLSSVTSIKAMFKGAQGTLTGLNNWDTSAVTDMTGVFYDCTTINSPLPWNTSLVTSMSDMFKNVTTMSTLSLASLTSWNIHNVTSMVSMFTQLIDKQTFTDILVAWYMNSAPSGGIQQNVIIGVNVNQKAFPDNPVGLNLPVAYGAWTFKDSQTGNTITIWQP